MRSERENQVSVLIVGAGAAGLTTAVALARAGVDVRVIERRPDPSSLPRATLISTRSMELFRSWGLEDDLLAGGVDVEWYMLECETLAEASAGTPIEVGVPTRDQSLVISPTGGACVPQDHLEPVLLRHLVSLGGDRVRFGADVIGVEHADGGVVAEVRDNATGASERIHARYLIAADGVYSTVRRALEIPMPGEDGLAYAVTALFHAPLMDVVGDHRYGLYSVTHAEGGGTFLPAGPDDRWLYGAFTDDWEEPSVEALARRIRLGSGVAGLRPRIERTGSFSFGVGLAETYRQGDVFLVGDAAHRVTPRGGTGMNTAIHDGYDLGWRLAWVLRGWAAPDLLDSYEAERRPVAEHNVMRSADPLGSRRSVSEELLVDLGGRIPHMWLPGRSSQVSTLDLLGDGLTLLTGPRGHAWEAAAGSMRGTLPLEVHRLDEVPARGIGVSGAGALLVRPDGVPVRLWADAPRAMGKLGEAVVELTDPARRGARSVARAA